MDLPVSVSIKNAHKVLEDLYLGEPGEYSVYFSRDQLTKVEDIFDVIIYTHGIKPVYFKYEVSQPNVWRGSPEQRIRIERRDKKALRSAS